MTNNQKTSSLLKQDLSRIEESGSWAAGSGGRSGHSPVSTWIRASPISPNPKAPCRYLLAIDFWAQGRLPICIYIYRYIHRYRYKDRYKYIDSEPKEESQRT